MTERTLEADYVIVGSGAVAMAFADTLLTDTEASIVMVDRRHKPGGMERRVPICPSAWAFDKLRRELPATRYGES